jgi:hypothetical protein
MESLLREIVGFEMDITRLEGKFKLSQNRSPEDREAVLAGLTAERGMEAASLAAFMERHAAASSGGSATGGRGDGSARGAAAAEGAVEPPEGAS